MQGKAASDKTRSVGEMNKRRALMADGKRYLIYYTFENGGASPVETEEKLPETDAKNSTIEEEDINV